MNILSYLSEIMKHKYPEVVKFRPSNPSKYVGDVNNIMMRSSWEKRFAMWCDTQPGILKWGSEIRAIPYYSIVDKRMRRYYVDFWILVKNKNGEVKKYIVEIKPRAQVEKPNLSRRKIKATYFEELCTWQRNIDKWKAASAFAKKNGFEFEILTEKELGIK